MRVLRLQTSLGFGGVGLGFKSRFMGLGLRVS